METQKIIYALAISCFVLFSCNKKQVKKSPLEANKEKVVLSISGMTCEMGCAKKIETKLSNKKGVLDAKVNFKDSIAKIEYDKSIASEKDLMAFVNSIAGGKLYKSSIVSCKAKKKCKKDCCKAKKKCKKDCKKACCTIKKSK